MSLETNPSMSEDLRQILNRKQLVNPHDKRPTEGERLHKLAEEIDRTRLGEIQGRFRDLNYHEIKQFCGWTAGDMVKVWAWIITDALK